MFRPKPGSAVAMSTFHRVWIEQCFAARRIMHEHDEISALDYLIGEKLMSFVATAEERPEFARELPSFVATTREIFRADVIRAYIDHLVRIYQEGEKAARDSGEPTNEDGMASSPDEWAKERQRLERLRELLTAPQLGTA